MAAARINALVQFLLLCIWTNQWHMLSNNVRLAAAYITFSYISCDVSRGRLDVVALQVSHCRVFSPFSSGESADIASVPIYVAAHLLNMRL